MIHKYRDPKQEIEAAKKIAWVTKQAAGFSDELPSHMRMATPRPTGKLPGMGNIAKNPFNKMQKIKVPKPPEVKPIKTASYLKYTAGGALAGGLAGYGASAARGQDSKKRRRSGLIGAALGAVGGAGARRFRKQLSGDELVSRFENLESQGRHAEAQNLLDRANKLLENNKKLKALGDAEEALGFNWAEIDKIEQERRKLLGKLMDVNVHTARSGAAAGLGLGGAATYGLSSGEKTAGWSRGDGSFNPSTYNGKHALNLTQEDVNKMSKKDYETYRKIMKRVRTTNTLAGAAGGGIGSYLGGGGPIPGIIGGGLGGFLFTRAKKQEKNAGYSHEYYMKNRQRIKQRNKQYRMRNAAKLRLARKRYNREVKSGARRKAKRIRSGTSYITYGGF